MSFAPSESHPYFNRRMIVDEDDNISVAKEIKRKNRRKKIRHIINSCLTFTNRRIALPANLAAPQIRPFQWMISSYYLPEEYQAKSTQGQSPWYLLLRCMLIDLPEQLENGLSTSWRDYEVEDTGGTKFLPRDWGCWNFPQLKWGRRIVFSEQTRDEPRWLIGRWLVVAYLWSDSREWLRGVNVGNLISFNNAFW